MQNYCVVECIKKMKVVSCCGGIWSQNQDMWLVPGEQLGTRSRLFLYKRKFDRFYTYLIYSSNMKFASTNLKQAIKHSKFKIAVPDQDEIEFFNTLIKL